MEKELLKLVQLRRQDTRFIALVEEPNLLVINKFDSAYELALHAIAYGKPVAELIADCRSTTKLSYDEIYEGRNDWKLLPAFDHPGQQSMCLVSGTGLTHKKSALNRNSMHHAQEKQTDSMVMYQWGVEAGAPAPGKIGVQPEWFYKGTGNILKGHGDELDVPPYADDGGEEPEIAGIYLIGENGRPFRVGFATGNEFSDHRMEKKNYLYLAPSKLRQCAIGPELVLNSSFETFSGHVRIRREGAVVWETEISSGEKNMAHNLANLEYHHFKYEAHRIPYQAHIHFFGADAFSYGNNIALNDGDTMEVHWKELGRPLKNPVRLRKQEEHPIPVGSI